MPEQLNLMVLPEGTVIDFRNPWTVAFHFTKSKDAEKFYICVTEALRNKIPLTIDNSE